MSKWVERWHGSPSEEGWSIMVEALVSRDRVAYLGTGVSSEAVRAIVAAHNAAVSAPQPAPVVAEQDAARVLKNFEITGPDTDGLLWLLMHGNGTTGRAAFNLGSAKRMAGQVALMLEQDRRAAIDAARSDKKGGA